ncbi:class IV adenylate cyclase [bacterium]|nr:class IV adenylate cyclase [bacterium]
MNLQEREAKFYIRDIEKLDARLRSTGAELTQPRLLERNYRLDTPEGDLGQAGRVLRIRRDNQVRVTYKDNARNEDGVIARTEIEFTTDNLEITRAFFEALGYPVAVVYEKYRRVYQLGDVEVMLDELPMGNFAEVEAANNTLIDGISQMLGLDMSKAIPASYLALFETARQNAGFEFRDMTFENFEGLTLTAEEMGVQPAD